MIEVYSKDNCTNCDMTTKLLSLKKVPHKVFKLGVDFTIEQLEELGNEYHTEFKSFPIIIYKDKYLGGFDELKQKLVKGEIK